MSLTIVKLSGQLGKHFGREYKLHLDTHTPAEAVRALCAMVAGFQKYLADAKSKGIEFAVFRGAGASAENIGFDQLKEPAGGMVRIAAVFAGAKNGGLLTTIIGAALIIGGVLVTGMSSGWAAPIGKAMIGAGIGMVAGGIIQMLSPQPKLNKSADSAGNQGSYVFSGAVNTTAQGNPVPRGYGRMIIGSAVISAGITASDYVPSASGVGVGTANGNHAHSPYQIQ